MRSFGVFKIPNFQVVFQPYISVSISPTHPFIVLGRPSHCWSLHRPPVPYMLPQPLHHDFGKVFDITHGWRRIDVKRMTFWCARKRESCLMKSPTGSPVGPRHGRFSLTVVYSNFSHFAHSLGSLQSRSPLLR